MEKVLGITLFPHYLPSLKCPRMAFSSLHTLPHSLLLHSNWSGCPYIPLYNVQLMRCHAQPTLYNIHNLPLPTLSIIPPLHCSFPLNCHSQVVSIMETCDSWSLSHFNLNPQSHEGKLFLTCQYPFLGCLFFANGIDTQRVAASAKYVTWFCFFDGTLDVPDKTLQEATGSSRAQVIRAATSFFHAKTASDLDKIIISPGVASAVMHGGWSWWTEVREDLTPTQQSRLFQIMVDMVAAAEDHGPFRKTGTVPQLETFIRNRGKAVGVRLLCLLMEYSLRIELDEETLCNPLMCQLHEAVIGHVAWVNDVCSFEAEAAKGDYFNILAVMLLNDEFSNLEEALSKVCEMIKQCDCESVRLMQEIKQSSLIQKPGAESYLEALGNLMAGHYYWASISARYTLDGIPRQANTANLPFDPKRIAHLEKLQASKENCK